MIVLDTNVLSELILPHPNPNVERWQIAIPAGQLFITAVNEAELRYGVSVLPAGQRRQALASALSALLNDDFAGRILPFDTAAAIVYAEIAGRRRQTGNPISQFDAQIAAVTRCSGAKLATRNTADFRDCGIELINPWIAL